MFELALTPFGKYRRYGLHDPDSGTGFSVVPELGATLLELSFSGIQVLDGYSTPEELEAGKWAKSAVLFPFPNRLRDGRYAWENNLYEFPVNNAATGNAIHGFARSETFEVTHIELTPETAELSCRFDYLGRHAAYPFPVTLELTFTITRRNDFSLRFYIRNRHDATVPFGFGWHPYFRLNQQADDHLLTLPACARVEIDGRMLPTGQKTPYRAFSPGQSIKNTQFDTCFQVAVNHHLYHVELHHGSRRLALAAATNIFPFFQVFIPPSRDAIAIEPMTCNVDALNNGEGLQVLPPGGDWMGAFRIEYHN